MLLLVLYLLQKGKDFGYFPRDAVKVEEVLIGEEVEVLTKVNQSPDFPM